MFLLESRHRDGGSLGLAGVQTVNCVFQIGLDGAEHVLVDFRVERLRLGVA